MTPKKIFEQLFAKKNLSTKQMQAVMHHCMDGQWTDVHIASFLALMRMKGETTKELIAAATVLRQLARPVRFDTQAIDIVGTGGDGKNTFNVSTACSFVVAAAGVPVAKHGNRSVSSHSGSADLLEQAGFILNLSEQQLRICMQECHLAFLFAPHFHPAMQQVRQARQQLGVRTLFNLLGPLINPAEIKQQVVGVFSTAWLKPLATVLAHLGSTRALVLSADDGLDEISIAAPTQILEYHHGMYTPWTIDPKRYGIKHRSLDEICVHSAAQSLELIESVFAGIKGAAYDMVALNAAMALYCAQPEKTFGAALKQAQAALDSGKAAALFAKLRTLTQTLNKEAHHD